ncbi:MULTISPECIES: NAD(P)/FAD-dependent oxidoreductase [Acinetobacter]|jgi:cyclohexanone monooxygenase|uniref:NAD(P)/FAD-dependent oxidoreductase n=1 Tax=Acinetobacter towneri TaxID=202956 RepID=A0AAP9KJF1_9GAMM|nr:MULTISPECIES: NAD(P)/FAD-dependent oxidoreductase [Acinetobacter]MCA4790931.1 NAD(P)/FAD-dependent oxidoreductase [Acinetobacter towneri]MCA4798438.1 NAD(P)/FAD-dependent oxidoreductase [Acinetobacter towneri]MDM1283053.1 NAD(P)/FAD-dependent oxidoreductase [Acinetobacter towneri]QGM27782.1 SidA/IucD/PvdA family monooxygenase [Acinetobacter towneri]QTD58302.1 NAD(P)/FAD-dependent oxidoreductase [Acinetobacter towneri]
MQDAAAYYQVAIIGAGFGGLAMAIRLLQRNIHNFVILEKSDEVGGTWRENQYPGAACDVQSHLYSLSFAPKTDWSKRYAEAPEIFQYIQDVVQQFNLREYCQFNSEVVHTEYHEKDCVWHVALKDGRQLSCQYLVFASGPLHVPQIPHIKGIEKFQGKVFHSSQWDHQYNLNSKVVASIGTGGSAIQYIPEIAPQVKQLYVMQRTAAWVIPRDERKYLNIEKKLFKQADWFRKLHRARLYWSNESRAIPIMQPSVMKYTQKLAEAFIRFQVKDKQLAQKLTPDYIMGCKRILVSNKYFPTFNRDNVELVTDAIQELTADSIITKDGKMRKIDCLIYGTGFITDPRIYLQPFSCIGEHGVELKQAWKDGAESYYGISHKGFPNLFQLLGPNTVLAHNSVIFMIESQVDYILQMMDLVAQSQSNAIVVKDQVQDQFNHDVQDMLNNTVWQSGCVSWYQQDGGKNFALWPTYTWKYWLKTKSLHPSDFRLISKAA